MHVITPFVIHPCPTHPVRNDIGKGTASPWARVQHCNSEGMTVTARQQGSFSFIYCYFHCRYSRETAVLLLLLSLSLVSRASALHEALHTAAAAIAGRYLLVDPSWIQVGRPYW